MQRLLKLSIAVLLTLTLGCSGAPSAEELAAANTRTLVLAVLNVKGSFRKRTEEPADRVHDTLQWWIGPERSWKIRTFALDHDIHVEDAKKSANEVEAAKEYLKRHMPDRVHAIHVLKFPAGADNEQVLASVGLKNNLEVDSQGFAYWTPDSAKYRPQSQPR